MHGLAENPVLPSLHLDIQCDVQDCLTHVERNKVVYIQQQERFKQIKLVPFHSCVKIVNNVTDAFKPPPSSSAAGDSSNKQHTIWYSSNGDDIGSLLIQFFSYYSAKSHFNYVYITTGRDMGTKQFYEQHHRQYPVNIQHPLRLNESIA